MMGLCLKIAVIIAVTHLARWIGQLAGPKWGGIVLGLPISTALVLAFYAMETGPDFATACADGGILGVAAAVGASVVLARVLAQGTNLGIAIAVTVLGYLAIAAGVGRLGVERTEHRVALALASVVLACAVMRREGAPTAVAPRSCSAVRSMTLRTVIPVVCLLTVVGVKDWVGTQWAGLLSTFPSTFLSVVIVTYLENGRRAACQICHAFPAGNYSMVAFLACFGPIAERCGVLAGFAAGYLAAALVLLTAHVVKILLRARRRPMERRGGQCHGDGNTIARQAVEAIRSRNLGAIRERKRESTPNLDTAVGV